MVSQALNPFYGYRWDRPRGDEALDGIRGDLSTPDGKTVPGENVTERQAFELLWKWKPAPGKTEKP